MPPELRPPSWRRFSLRLATATTIATALYLLLGLSSCADFPAPTASVAKAPMDVALDIGREGIFYRGTAMIPRGFNSETSFKVDFDLTHGSHPFGGGIGFDAHAVLGDSFKGTGIYQPLADEVGVISLKSGRLLLRGAVSPDGVVLDGDWFFDGKLGGGFRIARKGTIFF